MKGHAETATSRLDSTRLGAAVVVDEREKNGYPLSRGRDAGVVRWLV